MKKSKLKKWYGLLIGIIIIIIASIGFTTISKAANINNESPVIKRIWNAKYGAIGNNYTINKRQEVWNSNFLYCIQYWPNEGRNYKVTDYIEINGTTAKAFNKNGTVKRSTNNSSNVFLANILKYEEGYGWADFKYTATQIALYKYIDTWLNINRSLLTNPGRWTGWNNASKTSSYYKKSAKAQKIYNEASNLAKTTSSYKKLTNKTNAKNLEFVDEGSWRYIGPFKFEFTGSVLNNIQVTDENGKNLHNTSSYNSGYYTKTSSGMKSAGSSIKSGTNFYIKLEKNKTTHLKSIKLRMTQRHTKATAKLWFLLCGSNQRMMMADGGSVNEDTPFTFTFDLTSDLDITKIDEDSGKRLSGVGFIVKNVDSGLYVRDNNGVPEYVSNEDDATVYITDENGKLTIKDLTLGKYSLTEVKNPNYGYKVKPNPVTVTMQGGGGVITSTINNRQVYIKVSGYVWVDEFFGKDISEPGNSYYDNPPDVLFKGIKVELYNPVFGGLCQTTTTDENGAYTFEKVKILTNEDENDREKRLADRENVLRNYYIVFTYDGFKYTTVLPNVVDNIEITSKAVENGTERTKLNAQFAEITGTEGRDRLSGLAKNAQGKETRHITYYDDEKALEERRQQNPDSAQKDPYAHAVTSEPTFAESNNITASTSGYFDLYNQFQPGVTEIKYINMGLKEREKPDISITNDIDTVEVKVNGYTNTYVYSRKVNSGNGNSQNFNAGIQFTNKNYQEYQRAIYPSDIDYNPADKSNEIQIFINYKTVVTNQSTNLKVQAKELVNYHDTREEREGSAYRYKVIDPTTNQEVINQEGEITWSTQGKYGQTYKKDMSKNEQTYVGEYSTGLQDITLEPQSQLEVVTRMKLSKEAVQACLDTDDGRGLLRNVIDLNTYSTYDTANNVYAGVDMDSAAGNATPIGNVDLDKVDQMPADYATYEDDTDQAPVLKFFLSGERTLNGVVFEDEALQELLEEQNIRQGNGRYDNKESLIDNVSIKMVDREHKVAYYTSSTLPNVTGQVYVHADDVTKTAISGDFEPYNNDPIYSTVNYEVGNNGLPQQSEKVDISDWKIYEIKFESKNNNNNNFAGMDFGSITIDPTKTGLTDSNVLTNGKYIVADYVPGDYVITYRWGDNPESVTDENAYSVQNYKATIFNNKDAENPENATKWYLDEDNRNSEAKDNLNIREVIDNQMKDNVSDTVTNRDKTSITKIDSNTPLLAIPVEYNQYVTDCTQTDSAGNKLEYAIDNVDFGIIKRPQQKIDFKKVISNIKVTYANGQVLCDGSPDDNLPGVQVLPDNSIRIEIGNELIYGSQLEITYELVATNTSELDYTLAETDFYNYGYKFAPKDDTNMVQYDSLIVLDYVDNELTFKTGSYNGTVYEWHELDKNTINSYFENGRILDNEAKRKLLQTYSTVLETQGVPQNQTIKPGEELKVPIVLTRLLANGEELAYDNTGNVVQIGKNGGGPIIPAMEVTTYSPRITITPATGQSRIYYVIGIGALVVLSAGIILIRKKVLKK